MAETGTTADGRVLDRRVPTDWARGRLEVSPTQLRWMRRDWWAVNPDTGCWEWIAGIRRKGYARIWAEGRRWQAHAYVYTRLRGAIPDGLEMDHLCRNRGCVNPDHLEPVTHAINIARADFSTRPYGKRPKKRWARQYDACIECRCTDRDHWARGLCSACCRRVYRRQDRT